MIQLSNKSTYLPTTKFEMPIEFRNVFLHSDEELKL